MHIRLFSTTLLLALTLGNTLLAQSTGSTIDIQGSRTKFTGTLKDASAIMAITSKNVAAAKGQTITITRERDGSSPLLFSACDSREVLGKVIFKVFKPGDPSKYKIITLVNASIVKVDPPAKQPNTAKSNSDTHVKENISFTFTQIDVQYISGSTSTSDDWETPNQ